MKPEFECSCSGCKSACKRPGWFLPGEGEILAAARGVSLRELFQTSLAVDWWVGTEETGGEDVFVLMPASSALTAGAVNSYDPPRGCIFYGRTGLCAVHEQGKPFECAALTHETPSGVLHKAAALAWNDPVHQAQIRDLLGEEPVAEGGSIFDLLGSLLR
jgi:hypothetical protein